MDRRTDEGIVLRRWEYSETSQTVAVLTREAGIVRGLAKGALRSGSAFSGGFEPVTRGNLGWIVKPSRELAILTEWMPMEVYWDARRHPSGHLAAIYAVDLVIRLLRDEDPHPDVFDALDQTLSSLAAPPSPSAHLLPFQWALLDAVGWRPEIERDVVSGDPIDESLDVVGFRPAAGGAVSVPQGGDWAVRRSTMNVLSRLDHGHLEEASESTQRASALLAAWARELLGEESEAMRLAFPELKALR